MDNGTARTLTTIFAGHLTKEPRIGKKTPLRKLENSAKIATIG